jgi:hypothetical protein
MSSEAQAKQPDPVPQQPEDVAPQGPGARVTSDRTLSAIKKEHREKGRHDALQEMAKAAGYDDVEDFRRSLPHLKKTTSQKQDVQKQKQSQRPERQTRDPGPAPAGMSRRERAAWDGERAKINAELERAKKDAAVADRKLRQAKRDLQQTQVDMALREAAVLAGVRDVDFAVHQFNRYVDERNSQDPDWADKEKASGKDFDLVGWFGGLRKERPYLFGETVVPATTGNGGQKPPAPRPQDAQTAAGMAGQYDATKASREDNEARLRKLGINPHQPHASLAKIPAAR